MKFITKNYSDHWEIRMKPKKKWENALYIITTIVMCTYLLWRLIFTLPLQDGIFPFVMGFLLLYSEIIAALGTFELFWRKQTYHPIEIPEIPDSWFPDVDVLIATHNEPTSLLYNTVNACTFMDYPDKNKVHIFLCDDGNRPEVGALAQELGVGYFPLSGNKHAKSGNLNNALSKTDSPLIVTFDADMIPRSTFLVRSIPYFFLPLLKKTEDGRWIERKKEELDPEFLIGFIQTPQSFYNPDLFQYNLFSEENIPNEQDFFSKEINVMRAGSNATAYTGSNTVLSRRAMEQIGGFPTDTITEDFETGIKIQSLGYTTYATTEVLASGLSPTSIKSMISQRIRWARGVIQSTRNCRIPFNKNLSLSARISYMVNYSYWWSFARRFIFIMSPILFALFDVRIAICGFWNLLAFWGPSHLFYSIAMRTLSSETRNQRWSQIIDTILAPYMVLPVLMESVGIKQKKFKVTRKSSAERSKEFTLPYAIPHLILLGISVAALLRFTAGKYGSALIYGSIIIFWLVYNLINLSYAVFFMWGRKIHRQTERFDAEESLCVSFFGQTINAVTLNISEGGLAFLTDRPEYIPETQVLDFVLCNEKYKAVFRGVLVYVKQMEAQWCYGIRITAMSKKNHRQYAQLVYDRMHSLPVKMDEWVTAADDLSNNMSKRMETSRSDMRLLPRIELNKKIKLNHDTDAILVNFNYKYALLKDIGSGNQLQKQYIFTTENGISVILKPILKRNEHHTADQQLFYIINWKDLINNKKFSEQLDLWIASHNTQQTMQK